MCATQAVSVSCVGERGGERGRGKGKGLTVEPCLAEGWVCTDGRVGSSGEEEEGGCEEEEEEEEGEGGGEGESCHGTTVQDKCLALLCLSGKWEWEWVGVGGVGSG